MAATPTTDTVRAELVRVIRETRKTVAMGEAYAHYGKVAEEYEALLAEFDAVKPNVAAIVALDRVAIRDVPAAEFDLVKRACWTTFSTVSEVFGREVTRRKAAATKAERAAQAAKLEKAGRDFLPGQTVGVHAFGHWYTGKVVRLTRSGSVVVEYTSGTGTTRQKTVGYDKVRA